RADRWDVGYGAHAVRSHLQYGISDYIVGRRLLGQSNNHSPRTNNSDLFAGDLGHCISQKLLMIKRDISDDADERLNHIGRVQASSHAHFEHGDIEMLPAEKLKRHCGKHLEKAGM